MVFICGDFNINLLHVDSNRRVSTFAVNIYASALLPLNHRPTRLAKKSTSLIDNILAPKYFDTMLTDLLMANLSDHLLIFVVFDKLNKCKTMNESPEATMKTYVNYNKLFRMLHYDIWDFITAELDINDDYASFINVVRRSLNNCTSFIRAQIKKKQSVMHVN